MLIHFYNITCNGSKYIIVTFNIKIQRVIHNICVYKSHFFPSTFFNTLKTLVQKSSNDCSFIITTLALGSQPKQRVARLQAKRKTQESHHKLPKVQKVWGHEPSHSQVNSHVGNWSPKWTPEFSKCDYRGQNSLLQKVLYIIRNILKLKCLKWAHITHLDTWNTSYGQKKGWESNWQFDS
jgi:hypothetical protein